MGGVSLFRAYYSNFLGVSLCSLLLSFSFLFKIFICTNLTSDFQYLKNTQNMLRQRLDNDSISNHSCLCTVLSRQFLRKGKENICQRLNLQTFFTMHCLIKILVRLLVSIVGKSHLRKGSTYFMGIIPIYKFNNQASITSALITILEFRFRKTNLDIFIKIGLIFVKSICDYRI